ncbi:formylglycine-generating enzyme family protein [Roseomonas sp. OT10]|uniref:formylglycine-generating enzyme family protein n=1 Tax=Roseomonas cutis TaxID=2897332 RepID=UPI001E3F5EF8|nr:formylglycine-generating enzyme family protein [Roseomonas sp. OT10]UFN48443.1 formylglycine-generating enzyme family protein [Roseomonas sp. OT10]
MGSDAQPVVWLPGGRFAMGSDRHYPEEGPVRDVVVDGFWIDRHPVTNRDFARFVAATGHVTLAERAPRAQDYPMAPPETLVSGSMVFTPPTAPCEPRDWSSWWRFVPGVDWRRPRGLGSCWQELPEHPVVHVAHADAEAYAAWIGKALPTEAEWEFAARGGLQGATYAWGEELMADGVHRANTWQGHFPTENTALDGFVGTSPVTAFPPNGYGLHDMIGNVWEWTADWYRERHPTPAAGKCCVPRNPVGGTAAESLDPEFAFPRKVLKGGSHLCAPNYCQRYRPAARQGQAIDSTTGHIGFRCVQRPQKA